MEWANYVAEKKWRNSVYRGNSSGRFLHGPPLNNELLNIDIWLRCNKLSVNIKKTNYVTFSPSQRKLNHSFSLFFGGKPLIQSNVTKFLGLYLDGHLSWKYHINFVCKQIAKLIGILSRTRFYLSCKTQTHAVLHINLSLYYLL